jgi:hypothetical protein
VTATKEGPVSPFPFLLFLHVKGAIIAFVTPDTSA